MEDEMKQDELLRELEDVKSQLGSIKAHQMMSNSPRAMRSLFISSFQSFLGLIFISLFFISLVMSMGELITTVFFLIGFLGLFPFITNIFTKKEYASLKLIGSLMVVVLSVAYVLLWLNVLNDYLQIVFIGLSLLFFLVLIVFLVHSYIAYLKRFGTKEIKVISAMAGVIFLLFLVQMLYFHFLLITLYLILIIIFIKGFIDFTERFRK